MSDKPSVEETIDRMLSEWGSIANRHVAEAAGVSRQAVHAHLKRMVDAGELVVDGSGRNVRYRRIQHPHRFAYQRKGLEEHEVWNQVRSDVAELATLPEATERVLHSALTELVNNAIEHSSARTVKIRCQRINSRIAVEIIDDGVGIFDHLVDELDFPTRLAALQELSKGRITTLPEAHAGGGLYFVSRIADYFEIESGGIRWMVDNEIPDMAMGASSLAAGTRAWFEVELEPEYDPEEVFSESNEALELSRRRLVVKLFAIGVRFMSRSEARRLLHGLEEYREIILDFKDVEAIGLGFVDEVFRVWPAAHPDTRIRAIHMEPTVRFMVERVSRQTGRNH
jgi:anti-sigma regulatory factor (Ser/Thr protein kinase)